MNKTTILLCCVALLWGCSHEGFRPAPPPDNYALHFTVICHLPTGEIATHILEIDTSDVGKPILFGECPDDYIFVFSPEHGRVLVTITPAPEEN